MEILIQNGYLLTLDEGDRVLEHGSVYIRDGRITAIGTDIEPGPGGPDRVIDARGRLVMPGLVNSDLHADEIFRRGTQENQSLEMRSAGGWDLPAPDDIHAAALLAGLEQLHCGVTAVQDHWTFSRTNYMDQVEAVLSAYVRLGLRASLAVELDVEDAGEAIKAYEQILARWNGRENGRVRIGIAPGRSLWKAPAFVDWFTGLKDSSPAGIHFHFNLTKDQAARDRQESGGLSAIEQAGQLGLLGPRANIAHAVWMTSGEIELLARERVTVVHTLVGDLYTGNGVLPVHELQAAKVNLVLGSGRGSGGNLNLFDGMKLAAAIHRIDQPDYNRWPTEEQVLDMATGNANQAGIFDGPVGRLSVGARADIVLIDLNNIAFSPLNKVKSQLVCLEDGSSVETVLVDGKVVMEAGQAQAVDEPAVKESVRKRSQKWVC